MLAVCGRARKANDARSAIRSASNSSQARSIRRARLGCKRIQPRRFVLRDVATVIRTWGWSSKMSDQLARRVSRRPHDRHADFRRHVMPRSVYSRRHGPTAPARELPAEIAASIQDSHAIIEIATPSATSRRHILAVTSSGPARERLETLPAPRIRRCETPAGSRRRSRLGRPVRSSAPVHCGSASWRDDHPAGSSASTGIVHSSGVGASTVKRLGARRRRPASRGSPDQSSRHRGSGTAFQRNQPGASRRGLGARQIENVRAQALARPPMTCRRASWPGRGPRSFHEPRARRPSKCSLRFSMRVENRTPSRSHAMRPDQGLDRRRVSGPCASAVSSGTAGRSSVR